MCELRHKKLLILAGAGVHSKVVKAAKEMGVYTIVTDYLVDSPAKLLADESWMYSITDVDAIVERCKKENVDGVLNFCIDPAQKPYQEICERLGLPCYATKEQFEIMTDKQKFKHYCKAHNVDVIPDYSLDDILNDTAQYPLFIKPSDSRGSRGQSVCYNKHEALEGFEFAKLNSKNGEVICEKYMEGKRDIGSAFFVVNGEPYLVKFGDRFLGKVEDNLNKQVICTILPSSFLCEFTNNVMPRVKNMIKSLGIKFGPVFLQGFADEDTIRYYDPALRMPGGDYDLILQQITGFDTVKSLIRFALTGDVKTCIGNPDGVFNLKDGKAVLLTVSVRPGKLKKILGFDKILKLPNVIYGRQIIGEGEEIKNSGDIGQRVAAFGLYIPKGQSIYDNIKEIYNMYKVLDNDNNDMIVSKFDSTCYDTEK